MSQLQPLPKRVQRAIENQHISSEILLAWVQLAVVILFATFYIIAPKTFSPDAELKPVPWILTGYFAFTLLRLILARKHRLPLWLSYLSGVIEVVLLLGMIWSFHLQYMQPPSFYLKAPSLLYVFIFISLRALYFDFRFLAVTGATAAIGWIILVLYVTHIDPADTMVTRDYVTYMTSNHVLIGAEVVKILAILSVTMILVLAIVRSRRLLVKAVSEAITAEELSRFVPQAVAQQAANSDEQMRTGGGEVREATILFCDLESFTSLSESIDPVQLITLLNEYFAEVTGPIETSGGVITQYQGDAILASFNLPTPLSDHASKAIRTAVDIQRLLESKIFSGNLQLKCRIGINTGVVVGGLVGSSRLLGYTVHGVEVNFAARLEALNKEHGTRIIVSQRTRDLAEQATDNLKFKFTPLGEKVVRGRSVSVPVYSVDY